ncbi:MAG: metallophosphoesterase [Actinomycetales bacterium]
MVRILAVADEVAYNLTPARIQSYRPDLVVGCGDLPWSYLELIANSVDCPMVFVPGNHDPSISPGRQSRSGAWFHAGVLVDSPRPHGATNLDVDVTDVAGLRVAGLGGCVRYRSGPHQYTQREYHRRAAKLMRKVRRLDRKTPAPVDLLLTHAPPRGVGDDDDRPHVGIDALHTVLDAVQPTLHLHGHIHPHGRSMPDRQVGTTTIRNIIPFRIIEFDRATELSSAS